MVAETEIAWAAGFFDGEGHIRQVRGTCLSMCVTQAGSDDVPPHSLVRFQAAAGCGRLSMRTRRTENRRPVWTWIVHKETRDVIARLWPYLSEAKLQQASDAIMAAGRFVPQDRFNPTCLRGHDMSQFGRYRPNGKTRYCTECMTIINKRAWLREKEAQVV